MRAREFIGFGGVVLAADAYGNEDHPCVVLLPGITQTRKVWANAAKALLRLETVREVLDSYGVKSAMYRVLSPFLPSQHEKSSSSSSSSTMYDDGPPSKLWEVARRASPDAAGRSSFEQWVCRVSAFLAQSCGEMWNCCADLCAAEPSFAKRLFRYLVHAILVEPIARADSNIGASFQRLLVTFRVRFKYVNLCENVCICLR